MFSPPQEDARGKAGARAPAGEQKAPYGMGASMKDGEKVATQGLARKG